MIKAAAIAVLTVLMLATDHAASAQNGSPVTGCVDPGEPVSAALTEAVQQHRYTVLKVNAAEGRLLVRSTSGGVRELACGQSGVVSLDGGRRAGLAALASGDTIGVSRLGSISLLRQAWQDLGSPER